MLDKYLLRSNSTAYRTINAMALVVGAPEGKLRTLNEAGTFIWEQADGKHTLAEIIDQMCEKFDVDYAQAEQDAVAFIQELVSKNMLVLNGMPACAGVKKNE